MTGPKIPDAAVYSDLSRTIQLTGKETPCSSSDLFGPAILVPTKALEAIELCRACPVIAECRLAGRMLSNGARADTVMGGVRYNSKGEKLLIGQLRKAARDRASIAELEARGGNPTGIDPLATETTAA